MDGYCGGQFNGAIDLTISAILSRKYLVFIQEFRKMLNDVSVYVWRKMQFLHDELSCLYVAEVTIWTGHLEIFEKSKLNVVIPAHVPLDYLNYIAWLFSLRCHEKHVYDTLVTSKTDLEARIPIAAISKTRTWIFKNVR